LNPRLGKHGYRGAVEMLLQDQIQAKRISRDVEPLKGRRLLCGRMRRAFGLHPKAPQEALREEEEIWTSCKETSAGLKETQRLPQQQRRGTRLQTRDLNL